MVDSFSPAKRSEIMRSIKSADTQFERDFRSLLWKAGLRYRLKNSLPGKPDLYFSSARVAVFLDSCFWHGCNDHCRLPNTNREYWVKKINRNRTRHSELKRQYYSTGWRIIRLWEHAIRENPQGCVKRVVAAVRRGN